MDKEKESLQTNDRIISNGTFLCCSDLIHNGRRLFSVMKLKSTRGDSSIITTLLLTSVVIAIGIVLLSFFAGTNTIRENDYFDQTVESVQSIRERFCVESISVVPSDTVKVVTLNYGSEAINITKIVVTVDSSSTTFPNPTYPNLTWQIGAGGRSQWTSPQTLSFGTHSTIAIEITSSRGNKAYEVAKR